MKHLFLIFSLTLILFASNIAEELDYYTDYDKALEAALKEEKPLMLVQVTDTCPWCKKLERRTLKNAKVKAAVTKNFIPLLINRDKSRFPEKFRTSRVPTIFFIEPKHQDGYWESIGFVDKDQMLENLTIALRMYKEL